MTMPIAAGRHVDVVCTALVRNAEHLAAMLRQISDPTPEAIGVWNIGEAANHVAGSAEYFLAAAQGVALLERLDEVDAGNARRLAEDPERDPSVLADRLGAGIRDLVRYAHTVEGNPAVKPFTGVEVPLSTLMAIELGEVLVHGYDIARAAGLPWTIEPSEALTAQRELLALLPHLLDERRSPGARVNAKIRITGMDPFVVRVHGATLRLTQGTARDVDFTMSVDPAAFLLMYFNRVSPLGQVLRGKLLLWGRRPWKIRTFQSVFVT